MENTREMGADIPVQQGGKDRNANAADGVAREDWNVPILNSEQMYQALKRLGRQTQLVVYPGEHHGIRRPSFQKDRYQRYLAWYAKYVKSPPAKP